MTLLKEKSVHSDRLSNNVRFITEVEAKSSNKNNRANSIEEEQKYWSPSDSSDNLSAYSFSELTEKEKAQIKKENEDEYKKEIEEDEKHYKRLVQEENKRKSMMGSRGRLHSPGSQVDLSDP